MAGEWQTLSLAEVYDFSSGLSKPRSEFGSGHPFLSFKDVFYNSAVPKQLTELVQSTEQERARCSVLRGDLFLTRTSETMDELGMSSVAFANIPDATFNGFTKRLRPKRELIAPGFARYFFRSTVFRAAVSSMSTMSTRASLNNEMLERLTITFPDYPEQETIAHILGTLDDKIELNRRRNQTLEAMARAMFKDWFVDFGPVRAKMEGRDPYLPADLWQLFPDRIDDEGKPAKWQCTALESFASLNAESWTKKSAPDEILYVDLSNTKQGTIEDAGRIPWSEAPSRAQRILRSGDTIVGTVRPGNKSFALIWDEGMTGSTGFAVLRPLEKIFRDFVFLVATSPENIERLTHLADGAAYPAVRPDVVLTSPITVPPAEVVNDVLQGFSDAVSGWLDAVEHNKQESRTLAKIRDTLLPKLISGDLCIADTERFLEIRQ